MESTEKTMKIIKIDTLENKRQFSDLLLLADPDWPMLLKYLPDGDMFVLFLGDEPICEAVLSIRPDGQLELKNLATAPEHQGRGHARTLLNHLFDLYRTQYDTMFVGTAFPGLYEHFGFTYAYTLQNFFIDNYPEPIIDEGRQCIDMLYFRRPL